MNPTDILIILASTASALIIIADMTRRHKTHNNNPNVRVMDFIKTKYKETP
ncbi:MAG: hypothetical protein LBH04_09545 [Tannerellaceae bacterium]|jgi:hypothetical protein|nr:hypothetical protein [Tannerellaceae bacterium]